MRMVWLRTWGWRSVLHRMWTPSYESWVCPRRGPGPKNCRVNPRETDVRWWCWILSRPIWRLNWLRMWLLAHHRNLRLLCSSSRIILVLVVILGFVRPRFRCCNPTQWLGGQFWRCHYVPEWDASWLTDSQTNPVSPNRQLDSLGIAGRHMLIICQHTPSSSLPSSMAVAPGGRPRWKAWTNTSISYSPHFAPYLCALLSPVGVAIWKICRDSSCTTSRAE